MISVLTSTPRHHFFMLYQLHVLHLNVFPVCTRNSLAHFLIKHQSSINYKHGSQHGGQLVESELPAIWGNSPQQVLSAAPWRWVYITKLPRVRVRKLRYPSSIRVVSIQNASNVCGCVSVTFHNRNPRFDRCVVRWGSKNKHRFKGHSECFKDMGPCLRILMTVAHYNSERNWENLCIRLRNQHTCTSNTQP